MRRLPVVSAVSALAAILLAVPAGAWAAGQAPAGPVQEPVAVGSGGAVASMDVGASQAGIDVLKHGGNAVDAAVATASALGVTIPFVAGPGGGGFMVIYLAKTHQVVTIDGREIRAIEGQMLLDAAKGGDVEIPYFCYEPKLGNPVGACRMCLVEIEGIPKLQTSCSTPVKDGMVVHTQTERVHHAQNAIVEFLLVNTSSGKWTFPKGRIEPTLSASESAAREAWEEAGARREAAWGEAGRRELDEGVAEVEGEGVGVGRDVAHPLGGAGCGEAASTGPAAIGATSRAVSRRARGATRMGLSPGRRSPEGLPPGCV